jgi:hypothetical protein
MMAPIKMGTCSQCRQPIMHFGVCRDCGEIIRVREHWMTMKYALDSIPERYRDARWGSQALYDRVPAFRTLAPTPQENFVSRIVMIVGPTGAGKTTLACAILRWIIESAGPDSDARLIARAERARFIDSRDVPPTRDEPGHYKRACGASVLLLDDVGQEAGHGEGFADMARAQKVSDLLNDRDKRERETIVTTYGTEASWTRLYGAGVARRFWDAPDVKVIRLEGAER